MPDPDAPALDVDGLCHAFGRQAVLGGVGLTVGRGEVVALLGTSGVGKTTLLRAVAGLLIPDAGRIAIGGREVTGAGRPVPPENRRVGLVFQDYALFPALSVRRNVAFGLRRHERGVADEWLDRVGLTGFGARRADTLSGGEAQRVALARAMAPRPDLLLLDEPFANVDANRRQDVADWLIDTVRGRDAGVVLVTHDRREALALADRVGLLVAGADGGTLAQLDAPAIVYEQPATDTVARLTGPRNSLTATAAGRSADSPLGPLPLPVPSDGPVTLMIRPEWLEFETDDNGDCHVSRVRYLGASMQLTCSTPAGELLVERRGGDRVGTGARGRVRTHRTWILPEEG